MQPLFETPLERDHPYQISEINQSLSALIGAAASVIFVEGELSSVKRARSGHSYLTLSDDSARIPAVLWKWSGAKIKDIPAQGAHVYAIATLRVYEQGGYYQLDIKNIWEAGTGRKFEELEQLKKKLFAEGLFDEERKRSLPAYIRRVGVVTGAGSAAYADIIKTLDDGAHSPEILFSPARVQGDGAADSLISALDALRRISPDVIIIGRGGGASEDLSAFNDEYLVRKIAAASVPVISAVGHEIDVSLADLAADLRAATPTGAAEVIAARNGEIRQRVEQFLRVLADYRRRILRRADEHVCGQIRHLMPARMLERMAGRRRRLREELRYCIVQFRRGETEREAALENTLVQLEERSPVKTLARGYAVVSQEGTALRTARDLTAGDTVDIRFHRGRARAEITEISMNEDEYDTKE
ncbi:MAG: exodeoxyribonuclease VII large subunit [Fibrobacterota bacterium]